MANSRTATQRMPRDKRPNAGKRKAAGTGTGKAHGKENPTPLRPRPRPLKRGSDASKDAMEEAAEVLAGMGGANRDRGFEPLFDALWGRTRRGGNFDDAAFTSDADDGANGPDDDINDPSDGEEEYSVVYEIPFKNASRELILSSSTPFVEFLVKLSVKMEVSVTHLSTIGYIPSYKPKSPKPVPKLLESSEAYERMMEDIDEYRDACRQKNRGKGTVKPFVIRIMDTSEVVDGRASKNSTKKKDAQPAAPLENTDIQEHKLMAELEKKHACQSHTGKACYVLSSGEHYQYTSADLAIWATLMRRNMATIDKVPDQLKLEDKFDQQRKVKKNAAAANNAFNGNPMWSQMQMPPWMYMPPWMMAQPPSQASGGPSQAPAAVTITEPSPSPPRKRKYPAIMEWLQGLDEDEDRGEDNLNYQQFAGTLNDVGIIRLDDLLEVDTVDKLQQLTGMNWGTAKQLMKFAEEDKRKVKRARLD
ncbi:hypothetical protein C8J57DRAFT_1649150 [Mycena rebaudengoi]|nr:hypothetical protein C8J57DRAFT_1649150 [Mycena rebaudengoi]